ncbi:hypothetical protein ACP70R_002849 [Stipagrostis hirtigluma subsp. patula]
MPVRDSTKATVGTGGIVSLVITNMIVVADGVARQHLDAVLQLQVEEHLISAAGVTNVSAAVPPSEDGGQEAMPGAAQKDHAIETGVAVDIPESSNQAAKRENQGQKQKPYCYRCLTKGHALTGCTTVLRCDICFSNDHLTTKCHRVKGNKIMAIPCGFAVPNLGFYYIPETVPNRTRVDAAAATIKVIQGQMTMANVVTELERLVSNKWKWVVVDNGNNTFRALSFKERVTTEFDTIWAIGFCFGVSKAVDLPFTEKHDVARMKVVVIDAMAIPKYLDVVNGNNLYGLTFRIEEEGTENDPRLLDLDYETEDEEGEGANGDEDMIDEENQGSKEEKETQNASNMQLDTTGHKGKNFQQAGASQADLVNSTEPIQGDASVLGSNAALGENGVGAEKMNALFAVPSGTPMATRSSKRRDLSSDLGACSEDENKEKFGWRISQR